MPNTNNFIESSRKSRASDSSRKNSPQKSALNSARVSLRTFSDIGLDSQQQQQNLRASMKSIKLTNQFVIVTDLEATSPLSERDILGMAME